MPFRVALLVNPLLTEGIEVRQIRDSLAGKFVQITHPAFLGTAFGKLLLHAHAFCQFRRHVINRFALKTRFNHLVGEDDVGHVAA